MFAEILWTIAVFCAGSAFGYYKRATVELAILRVREWVGRA